MVVRRRRTSATEEANRIFEQSDKNQVSVMIGGGKDGDSGGGDAAVGGGDGAAGGGDGAVGRIYEGYQIHFSTVMQCTV